MKRKRRGYRRGRNKRGKRINGDRRDGGERMEEKQRAGIGEERRWSRRKEGRRNDRW